MNDTAPPENGRFIADSAKIEPGVTLGQRVIPADDNSLVPANARLRPACVIAEGVAIGQGAWVRAGAVVLRSIWPNAIVDGNPTRVPWGQR